ncbi:MAG: TetR/AcrR family transcriptional regulator [Propionibacteriaceae bacterium]
MTTEPRTSPPGRVGKRQAIIAAALQIFARDGYASASMDDIARVAHVAKPTIYNHFPDKRALFAEVVVVGSAQANAKVNQVIDGIDLRPSDVRTELEVLGRGLVSCLQGDGSDIMRIQNSEGSRFPELVNDARLGNRNQTLDALAGKLAQLSATGQLHITDPPRAARQLMALVSDEPLLASGFGTRAIDDSLIDRSVREGVDTFLAAFGPSA